MSACSPYCSVLIADDGALCVRFQVSRAIFRCPCRWRYHSCLGKCSIPQRNGESWKNRMEYPTSKYYASWWVHNLIKNAIINYNSCYDIYYIYIRNSFKNVWLFLLKHVLLLYEHKEKHIKWSLSILRQTDLCYIWCYCFLASMQVVSYAVPSFFMFSIWGVISNYR